MMKGRMPGDNEAFPVCRDGLLRIHHCWCMVQLHGGVVVVSTQDPLFRLDGVVGGLPNWGGRVKVGGVIVDST